MEEAVCGFWHRVSISHLDHMELDRYSMFSLGIPITVRVPAECRARGVCRASFVVTCCRVYRFLISAILRAA